MRIGVVFDMDGTLLDTLEDLTDAVNVTLERFGYPCRSPEQVRRDLGNGAAYLIARSVPQGADPVPVGKAFQTYYAAHCQIKTRPYDGLMPALEVLKREYPLAVVSNKPDIAVKAMSAQLFPGIYGVGEIAGIPRKPAPDMLNAAMAAIGVDSCVYVGDSEVDVATARNAGVPCVSVLWGFRSREELLKAGAEHFCEKPEDLPPLIGKLVSTLDGSGKM